MTRRRRLATRLGSGATLGHAARVAAVTTLLIAALYVIVAGILDTVVSRRLIGQVDRRLTAQLRDSLDSQGALRATSVLPSETRSRDLDDAPVLLWKVSAGGRATALSIGAPALDPGTWKTGLARTTSLGSSQFRLMGEALGSGGWLVAGQSLSAANHVRTVLLTAETAVAPIILIAIYLGSLVIGAQAAAPVERTRRRQLEFTADASHELRTPLSVIQAEVGLALAAPRPAPYYRAALERVSEESGRLRRIVDELLWLARFDSEPHPPGNGSVDLAPLAAACAERFRILADVQGRSVNVGTEPAAGQALVKAPEDWIDRLLGVLVDNACRYSPPGGAVTITTGVAGGRSLLVVEDDGPGIPEGERERLFDRFHRGTDEPGGAGLGLAIADSVVRSTGGRWKIGRSSSGGARMEVSWPRAGRGRQGDESPPAQPPLDDPTRVAVQS